VLRRYRDAGADDPEAVQLLFGAVLVPVDESYREPPA
jgi:hypothetical protein